MAISYESSLFESGTTIDKSTEEVGMKKITLNGIPVSGVVEIPEKTDVEGEMNWVGLAPSEEVLSGYASDIDFNTVNVVLDTRPSMTPKIMTDTTEDPTGYYVVFGIYIQGSLTLNEVNYIAESYETVKIKLRVEGLENPTFDPTTIHPGFSGSASGYVAVNEENKLVYKVNLSALEVGASGNADIVVSLVTPI